jgi:hypothetical protein
LKASFLLALFSLVLPVPVAAAPAISCHCFQDRSFDAVRPAAADPYLLATTQSSLLATAFGVDKKELVRARMTGTPGEALWVAHYLADRCGRSAARSMAAYDKSGSWKAAAAGCEMGKLGDRFAVLLEANAASEALASVAADEIVTTRLGADPKSIEQIRARGGSNAELVLAAFLARKGDRSPGEIYADITAGRATWGQMLERTGGTASSIAGDIRSLVE